MEYLALFVIVLLHEFGHALACRQVGGRADSILLWPLGGVAYVSPPPRPGALLWSIAAGPLVNVALIPPTAALVVAGMQLDWAQTSPDFYILVKAVAAINALLLLFNLLPVYPLDGGQILYALLWFVVGRVNALLAVSVIGLLGAIALGGLGALMMVSVQHGGEGIWFVIMAVFIGLRAAAGLRQAQELAVAMRRPRHQAYACPGCGAAPLRGEFWACDRCGSRFDTFASGAACPDCGQQLPEIVCPECHRPGDFSTWHRIYHYAPAKTHGGDPPADGGHAD
jgi:Zn-dependent protease